MCLEEPAVLVWSASCVCGHFLLHTLCVESQNTTLQVTYSAILFYGYVGLAGLALYACLRWAFKSEISLAQVWCLFGKFIMLSQEILKASSSACHNALAACRLCPQYLHTCVIHLHPPL